VIRINCDLCGKVEGSLNRAVIEGVELNVCPECSRFGKVLAPVKRYTPKEQHKLIQKQLIRKQEEKEEKIELLVEGYADLIKKRREAMGMTQKEFAGKLNEKESFIHKIETGILEPPLNIARKLEKLLGVKLIEEHLEKHVLAKRSKEEGFTLGDFIKIRK